VVVVVLTRAAMVSSHNDTKDDLIFLVQVTIDDFFMTYLATEPLLLELNQTRHLDYDMVAR